MIVKLNAKNNTSLRSLLESEGFLFPCGGKGLCGRCKIVAPTLPVTDKDKTFIPAPELERGVRLACDKVINGGVEIDCLLQRVEQKKVKITESDAYVVFEEDRTLVGLAGEGEVLDEVILPPTATDFRALRSVSQKETVELYEEHGLAKSTLMLLTGTPQKISEVTGIIEEYDYCTTVEASLFNMTAEEVLLIPKPNPLVGGDLLLEMLGRPEGTMLVKDEYVSYLEENHFFVARISRRSPNTIVYQAVIEYFKKKYTPTEMLVVGENKVARECGLKVTESRVSENSASILASNRPKSKLERLAKKVVVLYLAEDDLFQELLTEIANKA